MSPTVTALAVLNDLVDSSRSLIPVAEKKGHTKVAHRLAVIAHQLDATRTRLVQDGPEYIDTAWAYIDAGRVAIANYRLVLA